MKICLVNPPMDNYQRRVSHQYDESMFAMQHLGLGYISSSLTARGFDNDIIECPMFDITVNKS